MTCIIGFTDKKDDCVWIGGDSLMSNSYTKQLLTVSKVFRNNTYKNIIIGSTTSYRHIDLLTYSKDLFNDIDLHKNICREYMVTKFIPKIIKLFGDNIPTNNDDDRCANFIVGAGNQLFEIQKDYSVIQSQSGFTAIGCGYVIAMGSLTTTTRYCKNLTPIEHIKYALEAAEINCEGVQRPFTIINTKDERKIIIN